MELNSRVDFSLKLLQKKIKALCDGGKQRAKKVNIFVPFLFFQILILQYLIEKVTSQRGGWLERKKNFMISIARKFKNT